MTKLVYRFCLPCRLWTTHLENQDEIVCGACHKKYRKPSI